MSIASEISRLQQAKADIKDAIEAKGVTVLSSLKLDGYASCISQISGGGGQLVITDDMCFGYSRFSALPQVLQDADWSNVTNMQQCFQYCTSLTSITLSELSNVSNMLSCFAGCSKLASITLPGLSNVTALNSCFYYCSSLTSITLSGLSEVTNMLSCFSYCSKIKSITLSGLSKVTNMQHCFYGCRALQDLVVDSWGTVITNLTTWQIQSCTQLTHQSLLNLISALYTTSVSRTCTIGTTNLAKLTADEIAVATAKGWNLN